MRVGCGFDHRSGVCAGHFRPQKQCSSRSAWRDETGDLGRRPASNVRTHVIDLRAATMSTVELLVVLYFLLVAVALLALYLVERRWRKGP